MNIIVCIKHVPKVAEEDLVINQAGTDIEKEDLVFDINEWDLYALCEAINLKEKLNTAGKSSKVTAITVSEDAGAEESLRKALAIGADEAVFVLDKDIPSNDPYIVSQILCQIIKDTPFDIILTGAQSSDTSYALMGVTLASMFSVPYATLVNKLDAQEGEVTVQRELEGNMNEVLKIKLPALFTIQTGINKPRYVSIMGIKKARSKEIKVLSCENLSLNSGQIPSKITVKKMYIPKIESTAVNISGPPEAIAEDLFSILKDRGVLA